MALIFFTEAEFPKRSFKSTVNDRQQQDFDKCSQKQDTHLDKLEFMFSPFALKFRLFH